MHYQEYKSILSPKNGMNIYRGCSHGCIYCDSRSSCYNMKHDFCDVEIKKNAPQMLEDALKRKRKKCMIGTGAIHIRCLSSKLPSICYPTSACALRTGRTQAM